MSFKKIRKMPINRSSDKNINQIVAITNRGSNGKPSLHLRRKLHHCFPRNIKLFMKMQKLGY